MTGYEKCEFWVVALYGKLPVLCNVIIGDNKQLKLYVMKKLFTLLFAMLATVGVEQEIGIGDLANGLYMVRCGNVSLRFVKTE